MTQAEYLDRLGLKKWAAKLRNRDMATRDIRANAMAMRDLADPDGLGGFKVLIQERATCLRDVDGVFPSTEYVEQLPMPLLRTDHVPLYEGVYPTHTWEFDAVQRGE